MSSLTNALERILNWLQQNLLSEYVSVEVLEPGLTYDEIEEIVHKYIDITHATKIIWVTTD